MIHDAWWFFFWVLAVPTAGDRIVLQLRYDWKYKIKPEIVRRIPGVIDAVIWTASHK